MSTLEDKDDAPRTRSVQVEIEVPGTPEQVWQAIATGPGITAWFVPADVEERKGGRVVAHFGPGLDSNGTVTAWEPPRRFAVEERDWAPGAPPLATEYLVEARSGGTCVVRIVNSLFSSSAEWDDQLGSFEKGWPVYLQVLRLYLTHFAGQRCSPVVVVGSAPGPLDDAWAAFARALGLTGAAMGQRCEVTAVGVSPLAGIVERAAERQIAVRLDQPSPGIAIFSVHDCGFMQTSLQIFLYGDAAAPVAAHAEREWSAWMRERFPSAPPPAQASATA